MSKELSELTLILHKMDIDGFFVYQRFDNHQKIKPKNIEFLSDYPNPVLVSCRTDFPQSIPSKVILESINRYVPQRANALVIGNGKEEGRKSYIYPAFYCRVRGLS